MNQDLKDIVAEFTEICPKDCLVPLVLLMEQYAVAKAASDKEDRMRKHMDQVDALQTGIRRSAIISNDELTKLFPDPEGYAKQHMVKQEDIDRLLKENPLPELYNELDLFNRREPI